MTNHRPLRSTLVLVAIILSAPVSQAAPMASQPADATQPSRTSEVFGDWVLTCVAAPGKAQGPKLCEAGVVMTARGGQAPIAKVALSRAPAKGSYTLGALLPVNVSFPSAVTLASADGKTRAQLPWVRCTPGACLAEVVVKSSEVQAWERATKSMLLTFSAANHQSVTIPVSVTGMTGAVSALDRH